MKVMLQTLCRYNHWMNEKLYAVCATMPDELRKENKGAFFGSMHGTLNHLLLADRIWLGRFTGEAFKARSLDEELYSDFAMLRQERAKTDAAIGAWLDALSEEELAAPFTYTMMTNPQQITQPLWQAALHLFNHQTHHRGQITTLMEQAGYDSGITDLLWMLREEEQS
jgi:uncharacterized damage-inducible protein DinB